MLNFGPQYHKKEAARQKEREKNNPMKECVLKYDHFENIHRLGKGAKVTIEGAPNVRQVCSTLLLLHNCTLFTFV